MNTFLYIAGFFLFVGWIVLFIVSLADNFDDDDQKASRPKPLSKTQLENVPVDRNGSESI